MREIPIEQIPGIIEAGWVTPPPEKPAHRGQLSRTDPNDPDALYNSLRTILNSTKNHQSAWPFQVPVDRKVVSRFYFRISSIWVVFNIGSSTRVWIYHAIAVILTKH